MLKFSDVNDLDGSNLEIDGGGQFSQIKLHMQIVRKTLA